MPKAHNIMIHRFVDSDEPRYDDEGDQMLGFYYQFTDGEENPVSSLIGPYRYAPAAEKAAVRAFNSQDF